MAFFHSKTFSIMRFLSIFLGILLTVQRCSCTNSPPPTLRGPYYFTQEFKDYNVFQNGSKWIYQRENSQDKDTLLQEYIKLEKIDDYESCICANETYFTRQKSSFFNDVILKNANAPYLDYQVELTEMTYQGIMNDVTTIFFTENIVGKEQRINANDTLTYEAFYPSYTLEGKNYKDVKVFKRKRSGIDVRLPRRTFYAKNVGIIRRELWNGQVWNLIHHEVKQQ
jgi:hypothetical protein